MTRQILLIAPQPDPGINFLRIGSAQLPALMAAMPKAELHMHIEGSLEPELVFLLAQRHGIKLPYASVEALRAAYSFSDLQSFLDVYYAGAAVLITADDFYAMTMAYVHRALADNIRHCELFFDPQTHTARGIGFDVFMPGLLKAQADAKALGLSLQWIMCFLRHLPEQQAFETLEQAAPWLPQLLGVGLDSSEKGHPPSKFARVFARCRELGLMVVAHAGEEGPAQYVKDALDELRAVRIDHGVRSIEDVGLMQRLAAQRVPLTVCPLSNLKLCVVNDLADHPLKQMLQADLAVMINSDDPAYFGGYLLENFLQTQVALDLPARDVWQLAANSFAASLLEPVQRELWLNELNECFLNHARG
jgi:adenine deaminase